MYLWDGYEVNGVGIGVIVERGILEREKKWGEDIFNYGCIWYNVILKG